MRFLLIDRILAWSAGTSAVIRKNVSNSEDYFTDHFAGRPVMPGCLIIETCDQAARLLLSASEQFSRLPVLIAVHNAKLQHFVQPGDALDVSVTVSSRGAEMVEVRAVASVGSETVARIALQYGWESIASSPAAARACERMRDFHQVLTSDLATAAKQFAPGQSQEGGRA